MPGNPRDMITVAEPTLPRPHPDRRSRPAVFSQRYSQITAWLDENCGG